MPAHALSPVSTAAPYRPRSVGGASTAGKIRLLVVEEDILTRLARCQLLDRCGPFDAHAAGVAQAPEAARSFHPRAILIDLGTLDTAGRATVAKLKEDAGTRSIPVLGLARLAKAAEGPCAIPAGIEDILALPLNLDELLLSLRHHEPASRGA